MKLLTYPAVLAISFLFGTSSYNAIPQAPIPVIEQPAKQIPVVSPSSKIRYSGPQLSPEKIRSLIESSPKSELLSPGKKEEIFQTLKCESKFYPDAEGDFSTSTQKYTSFGLPQINLPWHPDITIDQAKDPVFAVAWTVDQFLQGNEHLWTCWRDIYQ